ncbi:MAG TPA: ABC transporter permease [Thermoanaerobaculia bacterium]|nr:ABC transporter permease [Thermoanaerobaculia bacterium]
MRSTLFWGGALAALLILVAAAAPLLAPYDPAEQLDPASAAFRPPGTKLAAVHLADGGWRLADRVERTETGLVLTRRGRTEELPASGVLNLTPEGVADRRAFLLGSDKFGRDVLSRLLYGTRISLAVSVISVLLALTLGVAVGSAAALGGPFVDTLLMRGVDALLSFPSLFLLIAIAALVDPGLWSMVVILGSLSWTTISRLIRAEILGLKNREFIVAARALGQHPLVILWRHLLPNAFTPVLIQTVLLMGSLILTESSLSFLGLGIQPPTPSWGNMISEGREALSFAWWIAVFPGAAIALAVIAWNLLGDGLRDALDPHSRDTGPRP